MDSRSWCVCIAQKVIKARGISSGGTSVGGGGITVWYSMNPSMADFSEVQIVVEMNDLYNCSAVLMNGSALSLAQKNKGTS